MPQIEGLYHKLNKPSQKHELCETGYLQKRNTHRSILVKEKIIDITEIRGKITS